MKNRACPLPTEFRPPHVRRCQVPQLLITSNKSPTLTTQSPVAEPVGDMSASQDGGQGWGHMPHELITARISPVFTLPSRLASPGRWSFAMTSYALWQVPEGGTVESTADVHSTIRRYAPGTSVPSICTGCVLVEPSRLGVTICSTIS